MGVLSGGTILPSLVSLPSPGSNNPPPVRHRRGVRRGRDGGGAGDGPVRRPRERHALRADPRDPLLGKLTPN